MGIEIDAVATGGCGGSAHIAAEAQVNLGGGDVAFTGQQVDELGIPLLDDWLELFPGPVLEVGSIGGVDEEPVFSGCGLEAYLDEFTASGVGRF